MSTTSTLSVEERLMRLESLLERLIAATPAASNTAASAAVTEPSPENATATNTSNDESSAFSNPNALEWKAKFVEDLDTRAGPMPRLSILMQESINAANDQIMLSNHTSRVIIDPTRIPAVIESLQIQRLEIDYIAERLIRLKDKMRTSHFIESLDLITIISPALMDEFCRTFSHICLGPDQPQMPESQIVTTIRVTKNIVLIVQCLAKMMTCDQAMVLSSLSTLSYPKCVFDRTKDLPTQIYALRQYMQELARMCSTMIELALIKFPDFAVRNKSKTTAYIFLQTVNAKSQLFTSTIDSYCQSFPFDITRMTHIEVINGLAHLLTQKCTEFANNKDFIRINGKFSITALEPSQSKWSSARPSSSTSNYTSSYHTSRSPSSPTRSPPPPVNHRNYPKYNVSAFDYDPSVDLDQDYEDDSDQHDHDQGVSAIDTDPHEEEAFLAEEDPCEFDYEASIAAVATRTQSGRPVQKRPELCYHYYWHLIGKSATGCSAGSTCPRIHNPALRDTFKQLVHHNAVPPPQSSQSPARGSTTPPTRNSPPSRPSSGVRFQAPREPH